MKQRGKFITVEGVEGVGKSTNIKRITSLIEAAGYKVLATREPGGTTIGERIRDILLDKSVQGMSAMTELLLMFAARTQHVHAVIEPALANGQWVVCDRFTDSSYAYQGGGRLLGEAQVERLEDLSLGGFTPDLTILLDIDVAEGLARAAGVAEADRFESEQLEFFERVRTAFLHRASLSERYRVIDAARPLEAVENEIDEILGELLTS